MENDGFMVSLAGWSDGKDLVKYKELVVGVEIGVRLSSLGPVLSQSREAWGGQENKKNKPEATFSSRLW